MTPTPDMAADEFRRHGYAVIEWIAGYLENRGALPVLPDVRPGDLRTMLPESPPATGEQMTSILADFEKLILPATTHWNHPAFLAYFANTGSAPGILGETLTAALNVNAMMWRTGPAATELEEHTLDWLRQMLGLPASFASTITDTASSSTLYALAAARELFPELRLREEGMTGRPDLPRLYVYCSAEAHSSVTKAVITLGLGIRGIRAIPTDDEMRMDTVLLADAIRADRAAGGIPMAIVATVGTTSTTAVDPVPAIADIAHRERVWLHVDAAYGGSAAVLPEMRYILDGCERAHSLVVNPHKWLLTPMDCSALFTTRPDLLRRAFQHVPEYLTVADGESHGTNLMDYGVSLGRRFRALKLWFVLRYFGVEGIASVIREHIRLAALLSRLVDTEPGFERLAEARFSTVVFRHIPANADDAAADAHNEAILARITAERHFFLSHTRVRGRYGLRVAIGNIRTDEEHILRLWDSIRNAAAALA